jgi:hypothetical protein
MLISYRKEGPIESGISLLLPGEISGTFADQ